MQAREVELKASLYLFDDRSARGWRPFQLTRPVGELLFGCLLLRERAERFFRTRAVGHLAGSSLLGFEEAGAPPTLELAAVGDDRTRVLLSSRVAPEAVDPPDIDVPATMVVDGQPVGWILPAGEPTPPEAALLRPEDGWGPARTLELEGQLLEWPWKLVEANAARTLRDVKAFHGAAEAEPPTGVRILGGHALSLGTGVEIEPGVILDLRDGPMRLEDGVCVQAPARLSGPLFLGRGTLVFGGTVSKSSIGPTCKVRGEIDTSVLTGHCNKAHDGYLGHALLGRWVNLGALTTNSDLKNNYGSVRVQLGPEEVDTKLMKVGCLLGDHVKTGIGTLLNTGAVVGAGSNLFGGSMPPKYVPPFSWGTGDELVEFRLDKFVETARVAMGRRDVELSAGMEELYARAWDASRAERAR